MRKVGWDGMGWGGRNGGAHRFRDVGSRRNEMSLLVHDIGGRTRWNFEICSPRDAARVHGVVERVVRGMGRGVSHLKNGSC